MAKSKNTRTDEHEFFIYLQYGGEPGRRLSPHERPLEHQDEFLKQLGYDEVSRRTRLGVDPELRHLIAFHVGKCVKNFVFTEFSQLPLEFVETKMLQKMTGLSG